MVKSVSSLRQSTQEPLMQHVLASESLLASVKAHLRTKIFEELHRHSLTSASLSNHPQHQHHPSKPSNRSNSLESLAIDSIIAQHFRSQQLGHALRVFSAEAGREGSPVLSPTDLLQLIGLNPSSPYHQTALKLIETHSNSVLYGLIKLLAQLTSGEVPVKRDIETQTRAVLSLDAHFRPLSEQQQTTTSGASTSHIDSGELIKRLDRIEDEHERRSEALVAATKAGIAARIAEIEQTYQHQLKQQLQSQMEEFKASELEKAQKAAALHHTEARLLEHQTLQTEYHQKLAAVRAEAEAVLAKRLAAFNELDEQRAQFEAKVAEEERRLEAEREAMAEKIAQQEVKLQSLKKAAVVEQEKLTQAALDWEQTQAASLAELQKQRADWEDSKTREAQLLLKQRTEWETAKAKEEKEALLRKEEAVAAARAAETAAKQREKDALMEIAKSQSQNDQILELDLQHQHKEALIVSFRKELQEAKHEAVQVQLGLQTQLHALQQEMLHLKQQIQQKQSEVQAAVHRANATVQVQQELEAKLSIAGANQAALEEQLVTVRQQLVQTQEELLKQQSAAAAASSGASEPLQGTLRSALQLLDLALDGQERTLRHAEDLRLDAASGLREALTLREVAECGGRMGGAEPHAVALREAAEAARSWEEIALNRAEESRAHEDVMRTALAELRHRAALELSNSSLCLPNPNTTTTIIGSSFNTTRMKTLEDNTNRGSCGVDTDAASSQQGGAQQIGSGLEMPGDALNKSPSCVDRVVAEEMEDNKGMKSIDDDCLVRIDVSEEM